MPAAPDTAQPDTAPLDIAVIGAGAAGLFAAIHAGRRAQELERSLSIAAFDGAKKLGAKILVAGGGRCNVTHHAVDESAYAGSKPNAIKQVLRRYSVEDTTAFFAERGVALKREDTGKLFPTTDKAQSVLDALFDACADAGAALHYPHRINSVEFADGLFTLRPSGSDPIVRARRVILCAGGKALPRTGSDGHGYAVARSLGHTVAEPVFPALVPLVLDESHWARHLSGVTLPATITAATATGKKLFDRTNSTLCTHFGLSGPGVLDASRHYLAEKLDKGAAKLLVNWAPETDEQRFDAELASLGQSGDRRSAARVLSVHVPQNVARAICESAGVDPSLPVHQLKKDQRRALARSACADEVPVDRDRGFTFAEVTAGGVPLSELVLKTMESKPRPGLHLAGEILDVDGRIGGFNFQWAWASGYIAGRAAADAALSSDA